MEPEVYETVPVVHLAMQWDGMMGTALDIIAWHDGTFRNIARTGSVHAEVVPGDEEGKSEWFYQLHLLSVPALSRYDWLVFNPAEKTFYQYTNGQFHATFQRNKESE